MILQIYIEIEDHNILLPQRLMNMPFLWLFCCLLKHRWMPWLVT